MVKQYVAKKHEASIRSLIDVMLISSLDILSSLRDHLLILSMKETLTYTNERLQKRLRGRIDYCIGYFPEESGMWYV